MRELHEETGLIMAYHWRHRWENNSNLRYGNYTHHVATQVQRTGERFKKKIIENRCVSQNHLCCQKLGFRTHTCMPKQNVGEGYFQYCWNYSVKTINSCGCKVRQSTLWKLSLPRKLSFPPGPKVKLLEQKFWQRATPEWLKTRFLTKQIPSRWLSGSTYTMPSY